MLENFLDNNLDKLDKTTSSYQTILELGAINLLNIKLFPSHLKCKISLFKLLHYFLLISSIVGIILRRIFELDNIKYIESKPLELHSLYYLIYSMIYVKSNLEIINYVYYNIFIINI